MKWLRLDDRDFEADAQKAAEDHLSACENALAAEEWGEEANWPETAGPYCGCPTCIVREVLTAAWPYLLELARQEK